MTDPPDLPSALADLASTAGDRPLAVTGIEERARRRRVRRGAGRAAIVTLCCAGLATGIALAGAGGPKVDRISASVPAPMLLERCTSMGAVAPSAVAAKGAGVADAASPTSASGIQVTGLPQIGGLFKAPGTVVGVANGVAVTIAVAAPLYSTPQKVAFAITAQTVFQSRGAPVAATILRAGSQIGFVATRTGPDGFRLELVEIDPDAAAGTKGPADAKATRNSPAESGLTPVGGTVEGKGVLTSLSAGAVSLDVKSGPLVGRTLSLTVTPATQFVVAGRQCDPSGLPAGTTMGFSATRTGVATYRLDRLNV